MDRPKFPALDAGTLPGFAGRAPGAASGGDATAGDATYAVSRELVAEGTDGSVRGNRTVPLPGDANAAVASDHGDGPDGIWSVPRDRGEFGGARMDASGPTVRHRPDTATELGLFGRAEVSSRTAG